MIRLLIAAAVCATAAPAAAQDTMSSIYPLGGMVQQRTVTLDSAGNASWIFTDPFPGTPAVAHFPKQMDAANPLICNFTAVSSTGVSIHCWRTTLLGLLTNLFGGSVTGGEVTIIARAVSATP